MILKLIGCVVLSTLLLAFVSWRLQTPLPPAFQTCVLVDISSSVPTPCSALDGTIRRVQQLAFGHPGSTLTVFTIGDAATAFEPSPMLSRSFSAHPRLMQGKRAVQREKEAFVNEFVSKCSAFPPVKSTPLFIDIKHAVAHARNSASANGQAYLYVITDLQETKEPQIVHALRQRPGTKATLPRPIDNAGVTVTICGYAQTVGETKGEDGIRRNFSAPRTAQSADRLIEVWAQLFSNSEHVKFDSFCPVSTMAAQAFR